MDDRILVIAGPTASGKSELALKAARLLDGEIISVDSMQLYRDLPIGTAQPSPEERASVPHHLTGVYGLYERAEVFRYCSEADDAIRDVSARGKFPILCGGTGLYLKALLYGLDDLPGDRSLRDELDGLYDSEAGEAALRERMAEADPAALEKFRSCRRRLIRALEVKLITGRSILDIQQGVRRTPRYAAKFFVVERESGELRSRISARADKMLSSGWIEEAEAVIKKGLFSTPTAHQALGYRQIGAYLRGEIGREELFRSICTATWQYARRQRTWFRHQHPEAEKLSGGVEKSLLHATL